ncbi:hypothetical protein YC2023_052426 [Brassica napus]
MCDALDALSSRNYKLILLDPHGVKYVNSARLIAELKYHLKQASYNHKISRLKYTTKLILSYRFTYPYKGRTGIQHTYIAVPAKKSFSNQRIFLSDSSSNGKHQIRSSIMDIFVKYFVFDSILNPLSEILTIVQHCSDLN